MTKQEIKNRIRRAYDKGYRYFKESDGDVEDTMVSLKYKGYFMHDANDGEIERTVRAKLEKLWIKNGFKPYVNQAC